MPGLGKNLKNRLNLTAFEDSVSERKNFLTL